MSAGATARPVPLLQARGPVESCGGRRILGDLDLDLDVADGARIGVLGPNPGRSPTAAGGSWRWRHLVAVSHDRCSLERIADRAIVVADGEARAYEGGWSGSLVP